MRDNRPAGQNDEQYWQDLREALVCEAAAMSGFGEVRLRIVFVRGLPRMVFTDGHEATYKLGRS